MTIYALRKEGQDFRTLATPILEDTDGAAINCFCSELQGCRIGPFFVIRAASRLQLRLSWCYLVDHDVMSCTLTGICLGTA